MLGHHRMDPCLVDALHGRLLIDADTCCHGSIPQSQDQTTGMHIRRFGKVQGGAEDGGVDHPPGFGLADLLDESPGT
ncbi:hypothetical protein FQZ97_1204440 [compost metagenome]